MEKIPKVKYEIGKEYVPTFDDAIEAYLDAPIYGISEEGITKVGDGKFNWDRNSDGNGIELSITEEGVSAIRLDGEDASKATDFARRAQEFAKSISKLWSELPGAAQTKENLKALALAKRLQEYNDR